jgi:tricorn protease
VHPSQFILASFACALITAVGSAAPSRPLLLQAPTVSKTQIAFTYGGNIWIVDRDGGAAHRLVTGFGLDSGPFFSPDGSTVAFSGDYDGNVDVYVVSSSGGQPKRLTYHPGPDVAVGWSPDGKNVLFRSKRDSYADPDRLFTASVTGGLPQPLPLAMAEEGSYSPDNSHLAYVPIFRWEPFWKHYHGGQTTPVWIANLADSSIVKVPRENSNDSNPMWVGNSVYFLSDRAGPVSLFRYDTKTQKVSQVLSNDGLDIISASAGPDAIVYAQFGSLHLYDLKSRKSKEVQVTVDADMPQVRPHWKKVAKEILNSNISPTGQRAIFEAHGEILTVPAEKGDIRNVTNTPGVEDRDPSWSPDGKSIAYFSDESGEYALHIRGQNGIGPVTKISLGEPAFYYGPTWSPDSKLIAYSDNKLNLWYVSLAHPVPVKVDTDRFDTPLHEFDQAWSPDGQWLAYTKQLPNHMRAIFVYSLGTRKVVQITDGMSDSLYPVFDKNGKYLYFTASTNMGLTTGWLDMTSDEHPVTRNVYIAVLRKDLPSPIAPESDDEKLEEPGKSSDTKKTKPAADSGDKAKDTAKPPKVTIDFDGISQRILALPIPAANYIALMGGKEGQIYFAEAPLVDTAPGPPSLSLQQFDLKTRKTQKLVDGISAASLSTNGEKFLYEKAKHWYIADASKPVKPGDGLLKADDMEVSVDPPAQWKQMYHEVWRIERDFFYAPNFHGLNLQEAEKEFEPYLSGISSREDLNFLFREMLSYMSVGHMFVGGGSEPDVPKVEVGLLGADYAVENGRYRFTKVYSGENWNPQLHAPLTEPGVNVKAGEYLLAVNGREVLGADNVYSFFQALAGKQVVLRVGPNPSSAGSREVTVVPIADDHALRNLDWIESNRRKVDQLSGGKLAYVYLPDTASGGYTNFNRYYFAQVGKQGVIVDERFNHGGQLADYIIDYLRRSPMSMVTTREGQDYLEPTEAIFGPKVMIINQFAGSGGDAMPWYFKKAELGPLVGERTWGGLVGIGGYPALMDGGSVMAPRWAISGLHGKWEVENEGIPPDVEVWQNPQLVREGHDPQLEKAVAVGMDLLKRNPPEKYVKPPYPDYHPHLPAVP